MDSQIKNKTTMTTTTKQYDWQLVCRDSQRDDSGLRHYGHSFWRDAKTGRISICDMSGERPDLTDDGVLWLSHGPWHLVDGLSGPMVDIPVICQRDGRPCHCSTPAIDGIKLANQLGFKIAVDPESNIAKLIPHLRKLDLQIPRR